MTKIRTVIQTIIFGVIMIALGVIGYLITDRESVTALIPSVIGILIAACGAVAFKKARLTKPALLVAGILCVISVVGPAMRIIPSIFRGEFTLGAATIVQLIFVALAIILAISIVGVLRKK